MRCLFRMIVTLGKGGSHQKRGQKGEVGDIALQPMKWPSDEISKMLSVLKDSRTQWQLCGFVSSEDPIVR